MTQITNISNFLNNVEKPKTSKLSSDNSFKDILEKTLETKTNPIISNSLQEISQSNILDNETKNPALLQTLELLSLLENYSNDLSNESKTLRDIEPLINNIKSKANELNNMIDNLDNSNEKIKNIAAQCAMTANNEYLKFVRGDYI